MILRVSFANITPRQLAARIQDAGFSATVFESLGAGAWGIESGSTAEFAVSSGRAADVRAFVLALLVERNEQAAYVTRADDRGTVARLWHADGRFQEL